MRGVVLVVLLSTVTAHADAPVTDTKTAEALFIEGRELVRTQRAKEACEKFHAAYELDKQSPGILLNLGICYEAQERLASAIKWYRATRSHASERTENPEHAEYEAAAAASAIRLAPHVATVTLAVGNLSMDASITVDGATLARTERVVELDRGTHVFVASAPGKESAQISVSISDREHKTLTFPALATAKADEPSRTSRRLLGAAIAGGSILVAAIGTGLYANHVQNSYHSSTELDRDGAQSKMKIATGVFVATSVVGAVIGGYLFFTKPTREQRTRVAPIATSDGLGIAIVRGF